MKVPVSMRIDDGLLNAAQEAAVAEHRSFANLVEVALAQRIGYRLEQRRMAVLVPEGAAKLRGAKIVPAEWETSEDVTRAQANLERLLDIAGSARKTSSEEDDAASSLGPHHGR